MKRAVVWMGIGFCALLGASCSSSSSATTSSKSQQEPLLLSVNVDSTSVLDGTSLLTPKVTLATENAVGAVGYGLVTEPELDWFTISADGELGFQGVQNADYNHPSLQGEPDTGEGRAISATITAVDDGRADENTAQVEVTIRVRLRPLELVISHAEAYVQDGGSLLDDVVGFSAVQAQGEVSYSLETDPPDIPWFTLEDGLLRFAIDPASGEANTPYAADYAALTTVDEGQGKPVELILKATDAGRSVDQTAEARLTVYVLPPPFELRASPATVTINSGSERLNAANVIRITLEDGSYLLGEASFSVTTNLAMNPFTIETVAGDGGNPPHALLKLAEALDYHTLVEAVQIGDNLRLIEVKITMRDEGRQTSAFAEQMVDVVVTLTLPEPELVVTPSATVATVVDGESTLDIALEAAVSLAGWSVASSTYTPADASAWLETSLSGSDLAVQFQTGQTADYDVSWLAAVEDGGYGKPIGIEYQLAAPNPDDANNPLSDTVSFTLYVQAPSLTLTPSSATATVISGDAAFATAITMAGTGLVGTPVYSVASVTPSSVAGWFSVDPSNGNLTLAGIVDYEALGEVTASASGKEVAVVVQLLDLGRSTSNTASTTVTLTVQRPVPGDLVMFASSTETTVASGGDTLDPAITLSAQNDSGPVTSGVTYTLLSTTPSVDWFGAANSQLAAASLVFASGKTAVYSDLSSVNSIDGAKYLDVVLKAAPSSGTDSEPITVRVGVRPPAGAFQITLSDAGPINLRHGESTFASALALTTEGATDSTSVTHTLSISPGVDWFELNSDNSEVLFKTGETIDYADAALTSADYGDGKPLTLTITAVDSGKGTASLEVKMYALPSALTLTSSASEAFVRHGDAAIDVGATLTAGEGVGALNYAVSTSPEVDWFFVHPSTKALSLAAGKVVDSGVVPANEDGERILAVTVTVTDEGRNQDRTASATVMVNVLPEPFTIEANVASVSVEHDTQGERSLGIVFTSYANIGDPEYRVLSTNPQVDWFMVDETTGDLRIAAGQRVDYMASSLSGVEDKGEGRPVYVTVESTDPDGTEGADTALASVIVYIRAPAFALDASVSAATVKELTSVFDSPVELAVSNAIGEVNYHILTNPVRDWFEIADGELIIKPGANISLDALGADGEIRVRVTARDEGRTFGGNDTVDILVTVLPNTGLRITLSHASAEFSEGEGSLESPFRYEVLGFSGSVDEVSVRLEGDLALCNAASLCEFNAFTREVEGQTKGQIDFQFGNPHFYATGDYYGRISENSIPLYLYLVAEDSASNQLASRALVAEIKDVPGDETLTSFAGSSLVIPDGSGDDLFHFPIAAQGLEVVASSLSALALTIDDNRFGARNIVRRYSTAEVDAAGFTTESAKPSASPFMYCAYHDACPNPGGSLRIFLKPGYTLRSEDSPINLTVTATIRGGAAETSLEAQVSLEVVARQDGTADHPFLVNTPEALTSLGQGTFRSEYTEKVCGSLPSCQDGSLADYETLTAHYSQTAAIDLDGVDWQPIGGDDPQDNIAFHGVYWGNKYPINNLSIDGATHEQTGFFGKISREAKVHSVVLENVAIQGGTNAGGLAGVMTWEADLSLEGPYATYRGDRLHLPYYDWYYAIMWRDLYNSDKPPQVWESEVNSGSVSGTRTAGGLIGEMGFYSHARQSRSEADVSVTGPEGSSEEISAGGLVGVMSAVTLLDKGYATGDVSALGNELGYAGGLVGRMLGAGILTNSFAFGAVEADAAAGGLIGAALQGEIRRTFATGTPSSSSSQARLGALIGENHATISDSYAIGLAGAIGLSGDEAEETRVFGAGANPQSWTCADGPFFGWEGVLCSVATNPYDFGWYYGDNTEYPVFTIWTYLTIDEVRALFP